MQLGTASRLPKEFRDNIRRLRSDHEPKSDTEDNMVREISEEVLGSPGAIQASLLASHLLAIQEVMDQQTGADKVLVAVRERLEELKTQIES